MKTTAKPTGQDDVTNPTCKTLKLGASDLGPFNVVSSVSDNDGEWCVVIVEATADITNEIHMRVAFTDKDAVKLRAGRTRIEKLGKGEKAKLTINMPDDAATMALTKD